MDCLDRTNVVQSFSASLALEAQLASHNLTIDLQTDPSTAWFNSLWADNGDAISRQYAGTAALKGDYTRTRERNISGALKDFSLTLSRYYTNIVNDHFAQATIDFLLGRANASIFADFEADMKAHDYAVDLRKVRASAVSSCAQIVIDPAAESLVAGWVLRVPRTAGTTNTHPFEEAVLLLTGEALYFCRLDWATEKVASFERIALAGVEGLQRGVYITSTLAARDLDAKRNVGFVLRYSSAGGLVRTNTRSLSVAGDELPVAEKENETKRLAFKVLSARSVFVGPGKEEESEEQMVQGICGKIGEAVNRVREERGLGEIEVTQEDVMSEAEAKRQTGVWESVGYALKRMVWA